MKTWSDRLFIRNETVQNETDWYWEIEDNGAWEGPKNDWAGSHVDKYFKHVKERKVVVTAGGNMGLYARLYSNMFEAVYVFEPDPLNFHCLVLNTQRDNVFKFNCALGSEAKFICLNNQDSPSNRGMFTINESPGKISMLPLDVFNFPRIDLLQLDVEHYEHEVMWGAEKTIERCKPVIVVECGTTPPLIEFFNKMNYYHADQSVSDAIWIPKE